MRRAGSRPEVLVVDDSADFCNYLAALVARSGAHAHLAGSPEEAGRIAEVRQFELAFIDVWFPGGKTGFDLCRTFNGLPTRVPSIMMTGDKAPDIRLRAFSSGAVAFHTKPFERPLIELDLSLAVQGRTAPHCLLGAPAGGGCGRLLVVDDDDGWRRLAGSAFQAGGFEVHAAPDGRQALFAASRTEFDVVFLDCMLPGQHGEELVAAFKAGRQPHPPAVVMWTASPAEGLEDRCLKRGADDFVLKDGRSVDALIRRAYRRMGLVFFGPRLYLDERRRQAGAGGARSARLNDHEMAFLLALGESKGETVSKETALRTVYPGEPAHNQQLRLNEMVMRLRDKLPDEWARALQTIHGAGYSLRP